MTATPKATRSSKRGVLKSLRYLMEALGFLAAFAVVRPLPIDAASNLGAFLGRTIGPRLPVSRRARANLRLAFPEKSEFEIEEIRDGMWDNLGRTATEFPHLGRITALDSGRVEWAEMTTVHALRDQNKAGILVSGHLANWEILVTFVRHGMDITIVVRDPNNPLVRGLIRRIRGVAGSDHPLKGRTGAKESLAALRQGRILGILFDQKLNTGIPVRFFGVEAMTTDAPAKFALHFGCPLVPICVERTGPGRFRVRAEAPLALPDTGDRPADVAQVMEKLNRILEGWIRERPEEWFWVHRRWPETVYRTGS